MEKMVEENTNMEKNDPEWEDGMAKQIWDRMLTRSMEAIKNRKGEGVAS